MTPARVCPRCLDARWICEEHDDREWPHDDCPGPGVPCPACNASDPPARPDEWRSIVGLPSTGEPLPLTLLVCESFKPGETGYATNRGVWRLPDDQMPTGAFKVRALDHVAPGKYGRFIEIERLGPRSDP